MSRFLTVRRVRNRDGGMSEWFKEAVLKTVSGSKTRFEGSGAVCLVRSTTPARYEWPHCADGSYGPVRGFVKCKRIANLKKGCDRLDATHNQVGEVIGDKVPDAEGWPSGRWRWS